MSKRRTEGPGVPRRALRWAFVMNWGQRGVATLFTFLLAALLGPHDFGVVALALVYINFIELFVEQGLMTAIVQRKDLEEGHLDSAFWVNLGWSVLLAGLSIALSGFWASANGTPELEPVIDVLSITIVLYGLVMVQHALLERDLQFKKLALRSNAATLAGGVIGVGLALSGAGVWALVAQQLALTVVSVVLYFTLTHWRPGLRFSRRHARELFGFSVGVFFANVAGFLSRRGDILLMGLFFTPVVVGIYRVADRFVDTLLELTARPVNAISLPHFSVLQDDAAELKRSVAACIRLTLILVVPSMLVLAACSQYVLAVLGPEWSPGVDALKLLALVGIVKGLIFFTGPLLFALAKAGFRAIVLWVQAGLSAGVVVVAGLAFSDYSIEGQLTGVAGSRAVLFALVFVPINILIVTRLTGIRVREIAAWAPAPLIAGAGAIAVVALVSATGILDSLSPVLALLVAGSMAALAAFGILGLLERDVRAEIAQLARSRRSRPGWSQPSDAAGIGRET